MGALAMRAPRRKRNWGQRGVVQERRALTYVEVLVACASSERRRASTAKLMISTDEDRNFLLQRVLVDQDRLEMQEHALDRAEEGLHGPQRRNIQRQRRHFH